MNEPSENNLAKNRPLEGIRVLLTRPESDDDLLFAKLLDAGAKVVSHPLIEFSDPPNLDEIRDFGRRLEDYSLLVFLSRRAALAADKHFLGSADVVAPIAAIGPGTSQCLKTRGYKVDFLPEESNSESMAQMLIQMFKAGDYSKPVLILRADRGSNVLPNSLERANIPFRELAVYQSSDITEVEPQVLQELRDGKFDWVTVTSSSIALNAGKRLGEHLGSTKVVSISPTTSKAATEAGLSVTVEATNFDANGVVRAIIEYHKGSEADV